MAKCRMELCTHWSGDGDVCPCAVFGMTPSTPDWADEQEPELTEAHEPREEGPDRREDTAAKTSGRELTGQAALEPGAVTATPARPSSRTQRGTSTGLASFDAALRRAGHVPDAERGTEDTDYRAAVSRAIADPGKVLPRFSQSAGEPYETVAQWQLRAVLSVRDAEVARLRAELAEAQRELTLAAAEAEDARDGGLDIAHDLAEAQHQWAEEAAASVRLPDDWRDLLRGPLAEAADWVIDSIESWRGGTAEEGQRDG